MLSIFLFNKAQEGEKGGEMDNNNSLSKTLFLIKELLIIQNCRIIRQGV